MKTANFDGKKANLATLELLACDCVCLCVCMHVLCMRLCVCVDEFLKEVQPKG